MKIGITCYPTYGGSGAVATELGIALARRGTRCTSSRTSSPSGCRRSCRACSSTKWMCCRYPLFEYPPYDLALAVRMHEVVRDHGLELLHVHYAIPHATSAWIAREMLEDQAGRARHHDAARHRHHARGAGSVVPRRSRSSRSSSRMASPRSREYPARGDVPAFGCTGVRVEVIPNFIDPKVYDRPRYQPLLREQVTSETQDADARLELPAGEARAGHGARSSRASTARCRRRS